jgi:hypothetical protein
LFLRHFPLEFPQMNFDDQLQLYFGTTELEAITPESLISGIERMQVDFGLEKDRGRRFALWSVMYMLGSAPALDIAFKDARDRDAARDFMDMVDRTDD